MSSPEDSWAFTFRGADITYRHLIFLSDELLRQQVEQIRYTILHEIGHVVLDHNNSIGYLQTESEIKRQEAEADDFARRLL
jgi:Zn-dependent peptidase ImmA (M78 family)